MVTNPGPNEQSLEPAGTELRQFVRFVVVGAVATSVHYAVLILLVEAEIAGPVTASTAGFLAGAITGYVANRRYTFESQVAHRKGLPKFLTVAFAGMLLNMMLMAGLISYTPMHYLIAQALATVVVLCWNYLANRNWTFRDDRRGQ